MATPKTMAGTGEAASKAAVVGADGFIGAATSRALEAADVRTARFTRTKPFLDADGAPDSALLSADTVFWLASSIRPATADDPRASAADKAALQSLLDALERSGNNDARVVVVSSGGTVYDSSHPSPHAEDAPLRPANRYGDAMLMIEQMAQARAPRSTVLRVANAYGPGQPARRGQGVVAYWLAAASEGRPIRVLGDDQVARDYVYIDDVVDALVRVHLAPEPPTLVNVGSGRPTTLRNLLKQVIDTVAPVEIAVEHEQGRTFDAPSTWLDVTLATERLGWRAVTDLATGLRRTWGALAGPLVPAKDHVENEDRA